MISSLYETFRAPDKATLAGRELAEAERCLLRAQSGLDYAKAMVTYESARVIRLGQVLASKQPIKEVAQTRPAVRRVR